MQQCTSLTEAYSKPTSLHNLERCSRHVRTAKTSELTLVLVKLILTLMCRAAIESMLTPGCVKSWVFKTPFWVPVLGAP